MRYLILFMFLVAIFVFGNRTCGHDGWSFGFGGVRGEGPVQTESRTVSDFHAIDAGVPGKIEVRIAEECSVEVQAQENLIPILKTEVKNGSLHIYFDKNVSNAKDLVIRVSAPSFDALGLGGSGNIEVLSPINGDELDLSISGSGDISLPQATVNKLSCAIAGSGNIRVSGQTQEAVWEISGSGDIDAKSLQTEQGKASIAGSGTVRCNVTQTLKAEIAGSGDVFYTGSPSVDSDIAGSGKVKKTE